MPEPIRGILDPAPIGQLQSLTIKSLLVGIVALVSSFGVKFVISDAQVELITEGILSAITIGSMFVAWYGLVRARQVVVTGAVGTKLPPAAIALLLFPLLALGGGCNVFHPGGTTQPSLATQIDDYRQTYTVSLDALTLAMQAGAFNKEQVRAILLVRGQIEKALDSADKANAAGNNIDANFWLERIKSFMVDYIALTKPAATTRPSARPAMGTQLEVSWNLHYCSSVWPNRWRNWLPSTRRMRTA